MKMNEVIRRRRKELGLTQDRVAELLGVSAPAVNKWENGNSYPDITLLPPLARLLKTDLNTLLSFQDEPDRLGSCQPDERSRGAGEKRAIWKPPLKWHGTGSGNILTA